MKFRKILARVLVILFLLGISAPLLMRVTVKDRERWGAVAGLYGTTHSLNGFDDGCVYVNDEYIWNSDTDHIFSLFPYAFYHSEYRYPQYGEESFRYRAGYIWYQFTFDEIDTFDSAASATPTITFPKDAKGNRSRVYEKNGVIYTENDTNALFFRNRKKVCTLPSEGSFFDPICVNGLDGAAIWTSSESDPSRKSMIHIYVFDDGKWTQARIQLPGKDEAFEIEGYVRRHVDIDWETYFYDLRKRLPGLRPGVGDLEIGLENCDGTIALYSVTYENGILKLQTDGKFMAIPQKEWIY